MADVTFWYNPAKAPSKFNICATNKLSGKIVFSEFVANLADNGNVLVVYGRLEQAEGVTFYSKDVPNYKFEPGLFGFKFTVKAHQRKSKDYSPSPHELCLLKRLQDSNMLGVPLSGSLGFNYASDTLEEVLKVLNGTASEMPEQTAKYILENEWKIKPIDELKAFTMADIPAETAGGNGGGTRTYKSDAETANERLVAMKTLLGESFKDCKDLYDICILLDQMNQLSKAAKSNSTQLMIDLLPLFFR